VIAHDRSGFGGGLFSTGIILALMTRHAPVTRSFVQIIALMGLAGFGAILGVHHAIGYTDLVHLAPAYVGCAFFLAAVGQLARELRPRASRDSADTTRSGTALPDRKRA
jgi:disulfide bond formation protein DsbB